MGVGYDLWLCVGLLPVRFVIQGRAGKRADWNAKQDS